MIKLDKGSLVRGVLGLLAFVNVALELSGHNPIPIDEGAINTFVTLAFLGITTILGYYKNFNVTQEAHIAQANLNALKQQKKYAQNTGGVISAVMSDEDSLPNKHLDQTI